MKTKNKEKKITEKEIRLGLLTYIREILNDESVVAQEVKYGFENKRADIVTINNFTTAYEIKSDFDSLYRINHQIDEYTSTFDYTYIVSTPMFLEKIREITPRKVGIICFDGIHITSKRKASKISRLSKHHLVASCNKETLMAFLTNTSSKMTANELREIAVRELDTGSLRNAFISELKRKFSLSSKRFLNNFENGHDDLLNMRRNTRIYF